MPDSNTCTIPVGYVCIPLVDYDTMREKILCFNADMADEIKAATEVAQQTIDNLLAEKIRLQESFDSISDTLAETCKLLAESKQREKDTAHKLFVANENILSLKREIQRLNDELFVMNTDLLARDRDQLSPEAPHAETEAAPLPR